jgi:hypothetical protein
MLGIPRVAYAFFLPLHISKLDPIGHQFGLHNFEATMSVSLSIWQRLGLCATMAVSNLSIDLDQLEIEATS